MVEGEVEGGLDDQLIDEAILGKKDGGERGELGRRGEVGSDDEEEKASRLDDNDGGRVPHVLTPPGSIRQTQTTVAGEITTVCLQDELAVDYSQLRRGQRQWRAVPTSDGDNRQLFLFSARIFRPSALYENVLWPVQSTHMEKLSFV